MSTSIVSLGFEYFPKPDQGRPVFNGSAYVGEPDTDPTEVANQKQLYHRQENGSDVAIDQPVTLSAGGVFTVNGSPAKIVVNGNYALKVLDATGQQVYYDPDRYSGVPLTTETGALAIAAVDVNASDSLYDYTGAYDGQQVSVGGYYTVGDGAGGPYRWSSASTATDDGGSVIQPTGHSGAGRWLAIFENGVVLANRWGLNRNGSTDDLTQINAALAYLAGSATEHTLVFHEGQYAVDGEITTTALVDKVLDFTGAEFIQQNVPTVANESHTLDLDGGSFEDILNVTIKNGIFTTAVTPSTRVNSNHGIKVKYCNGLRIEGCQVRKSHAGGIITEYCSNVTIMRCRIGYPEDTQTYGTNYVLADGITNFHCGRNLIVSHNVVTNTGDDSIAMSWFDAADPSFIGESVRRCQHVAVHDNILINSEKRGIFIGGVRDAVIHHNIIKRTGTTGINTGSDSNSTGQENERVNIHDNYIYLAGFGDGVTQVDSGTAIGGIRIDNANTQFQIKSNFIHQPESVGMWIIGAADIRNNTIYQPRDNGLENASVALMGTGIYVATSIPKRANCYGTIKENVIDNADYRGIWMGVSGSSVSINWNVDRNSIVNCVNEDNAVSAEAFIYVDDSDFIQVTRNDLIDGVTRASTVLDSGTHDGSGDAATLTDSGQSWTTNEWVGYTVLNTTDGSQGLITANDATTITATLIGGTDDDWDVSDAYQIVYAMPHLVYFANSSQTSYRPGRYEYQTRVAGDSVELASGGVRGWAKVAIDPASTSVGSGWLSSQVSANGIREGGAITVIPPENLSADLQGWTWSAIATADNFVKLTLFRAVTGGSADIPSADWMFFGDG